MEQQRATNVRWSSWLATIKIAAIYGAVSLVWILASDAVLGALVGDAVALSRLQTVKGFAFITATTALIGWLVHRDIQQAHRSEQALHESEERLRMLVTNAPVILFALDSAGTFTVCEGKALQVLGSTPDQIVGRSAFDVYRDLPDAVRGIKRALAGEPVSGPVKFAGAVFDIQLSPVKDQDGTITGVIGVATDVTQRRRAERQLAYLAAHDPLTGLFNRHRFEEELGHHLLRAGQQGGHGAVLFLDLDEFKHVNDSLGHHAGDRFLIGLAAALSRRLADGHVIARLGGDEFGVILPGADRATAARIAADVLNAVRQHIVVFDEKPVGTTASIGIALFPDHGTTVSELLAGADLAMYQAKDNGRNGFSIYAEGGQRRARIEARFAWEKRLRDALQNDLFFLEAQPVVDLATNEIVQYELLIRLLDDHGNLIPPRAFLDIAERFGLIHAIDRWVLRRAVRLIAEHRRHGRRLCLAVNVSGKSFSDPGLLPMIRRELEATGIDPSSLVIEITETAAIADITQARTFMEALKAEGCRFSLDDFGVGFASFEHLKRLPVDHLKIDGSFIANLQHDPVDQHLVRAMVEVARGLGKKTIAEFVGDRETVRILRTYGVDCGQGFHIGEPRPIAEALALPSRKGRAA